MDFSITSLCIFTLIFDNFSINSPKPNLSYALYSFTATEYNASSGHLSNQSIAQQLIIEGNILHLLRNFSPTGENAKTICKFSRVFYTKYFSKASLASKILSSFAKGLISPNISS